MAPTITLHSLLETHDQPFRVIDASLKVIAVNRAYEIQFETERAAVIGQPCCAITGEAGDETPCRHSTLFQDLEPYQLIHSVMDAPDQCRSYRVCGFPLLDAGNLIRLGESILPMGVAGSPAHPGMAGRSIRFRQLLERLTLAAGSQAPVLLKGEKGTGKELAAGFIHSHSARRNGRLVIVDCAALGDDLFESELFGHEKSAFTGSAGSKTGLFELADQGTLFLDEIGELPLALQPVLLRALESGSFRRVGGAETKRVDLRVISATHRDLATMVQAGTFREDLYSRLVVLPVTVPALRDRRDDIPLIARHLLTQIASCMGRELELTPEALEKLRRHAFPGNIRELRNALQLAATLTPTGTIDPNHVVLSVSRSHPPQTEPARRQAGSPPPAVSTLDDLEIAYIMELLKRHQGNRRLAAAEMNVSERTLCRKLKRYPLDKAG